VVGLEGIGVEAWDAQIIGKILDGTHEDAVGLAETMDYIGILCGDGRIIDEIAATRSAGGYVQGHAIGVFKRALASLLLQGVQGNHELSDSASVLASLQSGMYVDLAIVSSLSDSTSRLEEMWANCFSKIGSLDRVTFCTDDRNIAAILDEGHVNLGVKKFIDSGVAGGFVTESALPSFTLSVVKAATLNTWIEYGVTRAGAIASGHIADLQIIAAGSVIGDKPSDVLIDGKHVVRSGQLLPALEKSAEILATENTNTITLAPVTAEQLRIKVPTQSITDGKATVRVLDYPLDGAGAANNIGEETLPVVDGFLSLEDREDLTYVFCFNRYGSGDVGCGIAKNLRLRDGTLATTVAHDGHNLVVIFKDGAQQQAVIAANELIDIHGGITYRTHDGAFTATKPLPVLGLMGSISNEEMAATIVDFEVGVKKYNGEDSNPMIAALLSLTVIPYYRVTDKGLVDTIQLKVIPLFV
jgi:adenine deaminase